MGIMCKNMYETPYFEFIPGYTSTMLSIMLQVGVLLVEQTLLSFPVRMRSVPILTGFALRNVYFSV